MQMSSIRTATAGASEAPAATPRLINQPGDYIGTAQRVPFAKTLELQYGEILGQFDQLYDARMAARELSGGDKPAVVISTFPTAAASGEAFVEAKPFVIYDVDYAIKTRPLNPMTDPTTVERGDYHDGQVVRFGYSSKSHGWDLGAPQYLVDGAKEFPFAHFEDRN